MDALRVIDDADFVERLLGMDDDHRYPIRTNSRSNDTFSCCDRAVDKSRIGLEYEYDECDASPVSRQQ